VDGLAGYLLSDSENGRLNHNSQLAAGFSVRIAVLCGARFRGHNSFEEACHNG
jgi:hypothetical protein